MAYSRRSVAQAQQLYKIASDAAYTNRAAVRALQKIASGVIEDWPAAYDDEATRTWKDEATSTWKADRAAIQDLIRDGMRANLLQHAKTIEDEASGMGASLIRNRVAAGDFIGAARHIGAPNLESALDSITPDINKIVEDYHASKDKAQDGTSTTQAPTTPQVTQQPQSAYSISYPIPIQPPVPSLIEDRQLFRAGAGKPQVTTTNPQNFFSANKGKIGLGLLGTAIAAGGYGLYKKRQAAKLRKQRELELMAAKNLSEDRRWR